MSQSGILEGRPRVLCVDDELLGLESLTAILRKRFEVITAASGEAGLAALSDQGPFHVIVSDFEMPGLNGSVGCGIPADKLETIFEPYFTTKPPDRGTGLGLPVEAAAEQHRGAARAVGDPTPPPCQSAEAHRESDGGGPRSLGIRPRVARR